MPSFTKSTLSLMAFIWYICVCTAFMFFVFSQIPVPDYIQNILSMAIWWYIWARAPKEIEQTPKETAPTE